MDKNFWLSIKKRVIRFSLSKLSALLCGFKRSLDVGWQELAVDPIKHKFRGNQHTQRSPKSAKIEKPIGENATIKSASERKIKGKREVKETEEILGSSLTGYRLMDVEILADVLRLLCCQECGESNVQLTEVSFQRHRCASRLRLLYLCCRWNHCFYTSKKMSQYYEVNGRLVYGMRMIGQGKHQPGDFVEL